STVDVEACSIGDQLEQVSLLEKELDRYYNNSMYAPFEEEGVVEENAASDGDDFEGVGGHSAESGAEGIDDDVYGDGFYDNWEERGIDRLTDLGCMNLKEIRADHIKMLHFADREVAFAFYNLYAKMNGFAARRELCVVASNDADQFVQVTQKIRNEISRVKGSVKEVGERANVVGSSTLEECVRDPNIARQRTRRRKGSLNHPSVKGVKRCGICRKVGHNRLSCHQRQTRRESESLAARCSPSGEMYDDDDVYYEDISHHEDGDYYIPAHMTDGNVYADDEELAEQCATVEHEYDISLSEP
ncbi:hypothetical protein S245_034317, partial [Arachis hypogaea]